MGSIGGVGDPALNAVRVEALDGGAKGEGAGVCVAVLRFHAGHVDAAPMDARHGAGLHAPGLDAQPLVGVHQRHAGGVSPAPARHGLHAEMQLPAQEGARANDDGARGDLISQRSAHAAHRAIAYDNVLNLDLLQGQPRLLFADPLHVELIEEAVCLRARAMHRRTLRAVQHFELDAGAVNAPSHLSAERVNLPHQLPLGHAANRRIAGHLADVVQLHGQHQGTLAQPRRGQRGLHARMARANDDDVVVWLHGDWVIP